MKKKIMLMMTLGNFLCINAWKHSQRSLSAQTQAHQVSQDYPRVKTAIHWTYVQQKKQHKKNGHHSRRVVRQLRHQLVQKLQEQQAVEYNQINDGWLQVLKIFEDAFKLRERLDFQSIWYDQRAQLSLQQDQARTALLLDYAVCCWRLNTLLPESINDSHHNPIDPLLNWAPAAEWLTFNEFNLHKELDVYVQSCQQRKEVLEYEDFQNYCRDLIEQEQRANFNRFSLMRLNSTRPVVPAPEELW